MREAIGGSILYMIILMFIFIYIAFMGIILNFATAYRAVNYVLTDIEETEGSRPDGLNYYKEYLKKHGYDVDRNGLAISCQESENGRHPVYTIKTSVSFEIPLIGAKLAVPISYDTKALYSVNGCTNNSLAP